MPLHRRVPGCDRINENLIIQLKSVSLRNLILNQKQTKVGMTRGNQREIDRQRALNRHAGKGKPSDGDHEKRKLEDGKKLQAKIEAKRAAEQAEKERQDAKEEYESKRHTPAITTSVSSSDSQGAKQISKKKPKEDLSFLTDMAKKAPK